MLRKLEGKRTYLAAIIWALLPLLLDFLGLSEGMTIREVVEHFVQGGALAALRAGIARMR